MYPSAMKRQLATTPEWRIFQAVQPLFAADLPWRLVDAQRSDTVHADAVEIGIDKTKEVFRSEMRFLPINLPRQDISAKAFDLCIEELADLLQFLESLVLEEVIASAEELTAQLDNEEEGHRVIPHEPTPKFSDRLWEWLVHSCSSTDPQPSPSPDSPAATTNPSETPPSQTLYKKLEALRAVVEKPRCHGARMVDSCTKLLKLEHALREFTTGVSAAVHLNKRLQGLNEPPGRVVFQRSSAQAVSKTKWESGIPWDMSERLYRCLLRNSCPQHKARLRLNGFQLDECSSGSPPIKMFMSSCPIQTYWLNCQCTSISSDPIVLANDRRPALHSVCEYITDASGRHGPARLLSVGFTDRALLYLPGHNETPMHAGYSRMVSFEEILDEGLLRKTGGMFDMNDKAVLALSLARCLLHLVSGSWVQQHWTRRSVQFLGQINDVRDIWHPYVSCPIMKNTTGHLARLEDIVLLFCSFAQLLVELETGERVTSDPSDGDFEDTIAEIQEQKIDDYGRGHYNEAVTGCFQVKAAVRRAMGEAQEAGKDSRYLVRKAIYDTVVSRLERNFSQISNRAMGDILRTLSQGKRVTRLGVHIPLAGHGDEIPSQISHLPAPNSLSPTANTTSPDIARASTESCHSVDDNYEDVNGGFDADLRNVSPRGNVSTEPSKSMFFDGESSNVENSAARFADRFFDSFDEFRKQYIVPSFQSETNAQTRVRIAVLDTGINREDLRSRIDLAAAMRKNLNFPKKDRGSIKISRSFTGNDADAVGDSCGHGTHVASILLQLAPDADLYVAKVSEGTVFDNPLGIAKAIEWAASECQVDIINMSFGSRVIDPEVEQAIARAKERKPFGVLLFAAASNSGKNEPRTYPASDVNVMGVHALDGHGNDSGWTNPSPVGQHDNFGTLGLGIKLMWKDKIIYKSGSSFASPTAAAIAANVICWLYHMKRRGSFNDAQYNFLRRPEGMRLILKLQGVKSGDLLSVTPRTLFKQHPGEKDPDLIVCAILKDKIPAFRLKEGIDQ